MTTEIVEYSKTEAALSELASKYKGVVFDVTTREGMQTAVKGRAELRGFRVALEKTRKEIKEPALRRTQLIDSEARRITAVISALEDPIDAQIKKEEERKEWERLRPEREAAEKAAAEELAKKEAEEKRMAEERAEIERQRAELAKAESARLEAERQSRMKIEEQERAARMRLEEEARQERLARQAREEVERVKRAEEEARLKAERDKIEAAAREQQRLANELNDGYEILATFVRRFGHRNEFREVAAAISPYLRKAA